MIIEALEDRNGVRKFVLHSGDAILEIPNITEGYLPVAVRRAQQSVKEFMFGFMDACAEDANPVVDVLLPLVSQEEEDEEAARQAEGSGSRE
jgi:hypothetical protein